MLAVSVVVYPQNSRACGSLLRTMNEPKAFLCLPRRVPAMKLTEGPAVVAAVLETAVDDI